MDNSSMWASAVAEWIQKTPEHMKQGTPQPLASLMDSVREVDLSVKQEKKLPQS